MKFSIILLVAAAALCLPPTHLRAGPACPAHDADSALSAPLARTAAKIRLGGELVIVALGSSSTAGYGASGPAATYPSRLAAALGAQLAGRRVVVHNKGVGGETDIEMMRRLDRDVLSHNPDLVIWQLGTNALLREDGVTRDAPRIKTGVARIKAAGADVILMDPQYAPKVLRDPDHGEMVRLLRTVAAEEEVAVFRRFAIMRGWVTSGRADFPAIMSDDGLHMNDVSYRCIAELLADAILAVTALDEPMMTAGPTR